MFVESWQAKREDVGKPDSNWRTSSTYFMPSDEIWLHKLSEWTLHKLPPRNPFTRKGLCPSQQNWPLRPYNLAESGSALTSVLTLMCVYVYIHTVY